MPFLRSLAAPHAWALMPFVIWLLACFADERQAIRSAFAPKTTEVQFNGDIFVKAAEQPAEGPCSSSFDASIKEADTNCGAEKKAGFDCSKPNECLWCDQLGALKSGKRMCEARARLGT